MTFISLKQASDFDHCFKHGKRSKNENFICYQTPNALNCRRLGLMISKRWDRRASARNQLRRWLKESFRRCDHFSSTDTVVLIRHHAKIHHYHQVERLWEKLKDN
ncbi:MAG: ribonuclease P protein component [Legionellales bacterium]|nr:ribonuclease P protein component [Legionellales bacterium]